MPRGLAASASRKIVWRITAGGDVILSNMSDTDLELLARYAATQQEDAFAEIVRRHVGLVYSAALRQVRSPQLAEEVSQSTFIALARNARRLGPGTVVTAWLYQVTRRQAVDVVRREARRSQREQIATEMDALNAGSDDWNRIEPLLEDAMQSLDETDRTVVLLRFFERNSLREVGAAIGASEDAAQKRVSRALERLRGFFSRNGIKVGVGGLTAMIAAHAVQAAPPTLASTISSAAILAGAGAASAGSAISTSLSSATATAPAGIGTAGAGAGVGAATTAAGFLAKAIVMKTLMKGFVGVGLVAMLGTGIYQSRRVARLQAELDSARRDGPQQRVAEPVRERDALRQQVAALIAENSRLKTGQEELLRLRGEVTRLRSAASGSAAVAPRVGGASDAAGGGADTDAQFRDLQIRTRLGKLKTALLLTEEQEAAIGKVLGDNMDKESEMQRRLALGPAGTAPLQEYIQAKESNEAELKGVLTPEQQAAYGKLKQEEWNASARAAASSELVEIQNVVGLTQEQQDSVFKALYQETLKEQMRSEGGNSMLADGQQTIPRTIQDSIQQSAEQREKALSAMLSPAQLEKYRHILNLRRNRAAGGQP